MSSNRLGIAAVALIGIMAASATSPPLPILRHPAVPAGNAPLLAFGGRSAEQQRSGIGGKLDAALADLSSHASLARPDHLLEDLHSLSPAARFMQRSAGAEPLVAVDAVTRGDPQRLRDALVGLGLEQPAVFRNDVGGWLPVSAIEAAAARSEVASVRAALSRARATGPVATQGDFAQDSFGLRTAFPALTGSGVTVGVLSVSYNCYNVYETSAGGPPATAPNGTGYAQNGFNVNAQTDVTNGALPAAGVNVLEEAGGTFGTAGSQDCLSYGQPLQTPFSDEGRAMLQIVHAVAPGAALAFYSAENSEADFANGIQRLANAGAKVVADDVGYFDEPFFQDGLVAQAIDTVESQGVAYFSAAGNDGNLAYDNTVPKFSIAGSGAQAGEMLLNFDASGITNAPALTVNVPAIAPGQFIAVVLEWDQPFLTGAYPGTPGSTPGATSKLDLCVSVPAGTGVMVYNYGVQTATCTGLNATGTDPVQIMIVADPASAASSTKATTVSISVGLGSGSAAPGRIKVAWEDDGLGSSIANFPPTSNPTIQGHPGAAGAAAVGAAFFGNTPLCGNTPAVLEGFSSLGGSPILFDTSGNRLQVPVERQKPDFVGPDGTNTTFFGFPLPAGFDKSTVPQCANNAALPNYFGTSAATPHAAGLAALLLQANPAITPTDIYQGISFTAAPMVNPSPDLATGYGFIQASAALAWPNMSITPSTITLGQSATLAWNAASVNTCSATAGFSTNALSGNMNITPNATGAITYTMTCNNAAGGTATENATLTVNAVTPLSVSTSSLPAGQVGAAYSTTLAATGGTAPYSWTLTSGMLPSGLALASSGAITGTPTAAASNVALTFKVTDSGNPVQSTTVNLSLTIAAAPGSGGSHSGGGGGLDELTLLALAGFGLARLVRPVRVKARRLAA
jgi:hypothetical protein